MWFTIFLVTETPIFTNILIEEEEVSEVYKYDPILTLILLIYLLLILAKK